MDKHASYYSQHTMMLVLKQTFQHIRPNSCVVSENLSPLSNVSTIEIYRSGSFDFDNVYCHKWGYSTSINEHQRNKLKFKHKPKKISISSVKHQKEGKISPLSNKEGLNISPSIAKDNKFEQRRRDKWGVEAIKAYLRDEPGALHALGEAGRALGWIDHRPSDKERRSLPEASRRGSRNGGAAPPARAPGKKKGLRQHGREGAADGATGDRHWWPSSPLRRLLPVL